MATKRSKLLFILVPLALILLVVASLGGRYWWYRGYSKGSRTGVIRKMSVKGSPLCKYVSAELLLQGGQPGVPQEVWEFSVDDDSADNPIMKHLHEAEKTGKRVTLEYRQDLHSLYRCTPSEYFVVRVEQ